MSKRPLSTSREMVRELPAILDYTGEFGAELILFLPFCEWLSSRGLLADRSIRTYAGMKCFYDHLNCAALVEKHDKRIYIPPDRRPEWMPIRNEHNFDTRISKRFMHYPDLRGRFSSYRVPNEIAHSKKPILVIHNKHNLEWNRGPVNYIPLESLNQLFGRLCPKYTIVYVRHGTDPGPGYSKDHNTPLAFGDDQILQRYPGVLNFDDLYKAHQFSYDLNTFKNAIYSRCYHFITSQGGGAHHIALFSSSLLAIFHKAGKEIKWAYDTGYYSFMAVPPPVRLVCTNTDDVLSAIAVFESSRVSRGKMCVNRSVKHLLAHLSPARLAKQ